MIVKIRDVDIIGIVFNTKVEETDKWFDARIFYTRDFFHHDILFLEEELEFIIWG